MSSMLCPKSVLITGANRGIGLEFVRQFLGLEKPPVHVFATCRSPDSAKDLQDIAKSNSSVKILKLDISDTASFGKVRTDVEVILQGDGLNLLINNAGIYHMADLVSVTVEAMLEVFKTNTVGPLFLAKEFLPLLKNASKSMPGEPMSCSKSAIINLTSKVGSMEDNRMGGLYASRVSKAGLTMVTKNLSVDLQPDDVMCVCLHPGWVQTAMGGTNALITTEQSVKGMLNVMTELNADSNGIMLDYAGKVIPW